MSAIVIEKIASDRGTFIAHVHNTAANKHASVWRNNPHCKFSVCLAEDETCERPAKHAGFYSRSTKAAALKLAEEMVSE